MPDDDRVDSLIDEADEALAEGDTERALERFDQALEIEPEHWGASIGRIECLHLLWHTNDALREVRALAPLENDEDDPERLELEGEILEVTGDFETADRLFALAHQADPKAFPLPTRTTVDDFRTILDKVMESLPDVIRGAIQEVPVIVDPKPKRAIAERAPHITPEVLGLFVGSSLADKVVAVSGYPNVVMLFQRNLERAGRSRTEVAKEIKITLLHEYGHYLGFDEEELEHLGLG